MASADARFTQIPEKKRAKQQQKDDEAFYTQRLLVPGEDFDLFSHEAASPERSAEENRSLDKRSGRKTLVQTAAARSKVFREDLRTKRALAVAPYSREMAVAPVAGRADDRPVDLPRDPRALRYALGGPQGSFERAFDGSKSASALAPPPRPPEPPSPLARTAGLALERRPRTGSPPPMHKFRNPVYPAGSTFGRT